MQHSRNSKLGRVRRAEHCLRSDTKNPLEVNNRVATVLPTHLPVLGAATSQQGTKVFSINQDPCIYRQCDHLRRSASGVEISGELRVTIRLSAEMI